MINILPIIVSISWTYNNESAYRYNLITDPNTNTTITGFSSNILISTNNEYPQHVEPTLAISTNNTIFIGWKNAELSYTAGVRVSYSKSTDKGTTFSRPLNMRFSNNNSPLGQSDPWMVWFNNSLYYTYLEYGFYNNFSQVTFASSTNYGNSWNLSSASYNQGFADKETMAVSPEGTIYIVYNDDNLTNPNTYASVIRLVNSSNGGKSFNYQSIVTNDNSTNKIAAYVTTDHSGNVYTTWTNFLDNTGTGGIYLANLNNGEAQFHEKSNISNTNTSIVYESYGNNHTSFLAFSAIKFDKSERLYLLWPETNQSTHLWNIYLRYSDDYGQTWGKTYLVVPNISGNTWMPDMDIDSNNKIHIIWYGQTGENFNLYYRNVQFSGQNRDIPSWSKILMVSSASTPVFFSRPGDYISIRVDANNIPHVVWTDGRTGTLNIYYSHGITTTSSQSNSVPGFSAVYIISSIVLLLAVIKIKSRSSR